jgi:hypothetical protein
MIEQILHEEKPKYGKYFLATEAPKKKASNSNVKITRKKNTFDNFALNDAEDLAVDDMDFDGTDDLDDVDSFDGMSLDDVVEPDPVEIPNPNSRQKVVDSVADIKKKPKVTENDLDKFDGPDEIPSPIEAPSEDNGPAPIETPNPGPEPIESPSEDDGPAPIESPDGGGGDGPAPIEAPSEDDGPAPIETPDQGPTPIEAPSDVQVDTPSNNEEPAAIPPPEDGGDGGPEPIESPSEDDGPAPIESPDGGGGDGPAPIEAPSDVQVDTPSNNEEPAAIPPPEDGGDDGPAPIASPDNNGDPNNQQPDNGDGPAPIASPDNNGDPNNQQPDTNFNNQTDNQQNNPNNQNQNNPPGAEYDSTRKYLLFKEYMSLYNAIDNYIFKLEDSINDDLKANQIIKTAVNKLREIKELIYDYILIKFDNNTYVQSLLFYQNLIVSVQIVFRFLGDIERQDKYD